LNGFWFAPVKLLLDSHGETIVIFRTSDSEQSGLVDGDEPPPQVGSIDDIIEQEIEENVIVVDENKNYDSLNKFFYLNKVYDSNSSKIVKDVSDFIEELYCPKHEEFLPKNDVVKFYESLQEIVDDSLEWNFAPESEVVAWYV
jgi:hypothetical protein